MEIFAHHTATHSIQMNAQLVIGLALVALMIAVILVWRHEK